MSSALPPDRVALVGRSPAERSVVAAALRRVGCEVIEITRGAELDLPLLRQVAIVVALDQHAFVERLLLDAQEQQLRPLYLPLAHHASPDALAEGIARAREDDAPSPWDEDAHDPAAVAAQHVYDLKPELDPALEGPGDLSALDAGGAPRWMIVAIAVVLLGAIAYLRFSPEPPLTERERAALYAEQVLQTERAAYRSAEHIIYRSRSLAREHSLRLDASGVTCERLLAEGRTELALTVCGRAQAQSDAHTGNYARALIGSARLDDASRILQVRLDDAPADPSAWAALAELSRLRGDAEAEARALRAMIEIERAIDRTAPWRTRLDALDAAEAPEAAEALEAPAAEAPNAAEALEAPTTP